MTYSPSFIDEHRYINVEDRWWSESTTEYHQEQLRSFGLSNIKIQFSGFGSQGDGASFRADVQDMPTFLTHITGREDSWPVWRTFANKGLLRVKIETSGHYCHEYTMNVSIDVDRIEFALDYEDDNDPMYHIHKTWDDTIDAELKDFDIELTDWCRSYARQIFRELEDEYDYLVSDEAVIETLVANEITEDEEVALID